jgi:hypothetical protein
LQIAQRLGEISGGAIPQKILNGIAGGDKEDTLAAMQELMKITYSQVAQQYSSMSGGKSIPALDTLVGGNPDISKYAQVFDLLNNQLQSQTEFAKSRLDFYNNYVKTNPGGNPASAFLDYSRKTGLTPENMTSWKSQNTINGQSINTLLSNPPSASAKNLAETLKANPGKIATLSGGQRVQYDSQTGTYITVGGQ